MTNCWSLRQTSLIILLFITNFLWMRSYAYYYCLVGKMAKSCSTRGIIQRIGSVTSKTVSRRFSSTHSAETTVKRTSFYENVGSPRFICAPMVDQSDLAFRLLVRSNGVDLAFTQMLNSKTFSRDSSYRREYSDWLRYRACDDSGLSRAEIDQAEEFAKRYDQPLIVQFNGNDPETLVKAGQYIDTTVAGIDLNLGCPQGIARKGNYGAYLLNSKDQSIIFNILTEMVKRLRCPVTVKIRKLSTGNDEDTVRFCQRLADIGVSMITIHGRLLEQSKLFMGPADWNIIRKVKAAVTTVPIIANGGIETYEDALLCLEETGADGVMSSEALLSNPKLFNRSNLFDYRENYISNQLQTVTEYLNLVRLYPPPHPEITVVRGHLFKMLHRFLHAEKNSDLREKLVKGDVESMRLVVEMLKERMFRYIQIGGPESFELAKREGFCIDTTWYMRHRDEKAQQRRLILPRGGLPYSLDQEVVRRQQAVL